MSTGGDMSTSGDMSTGGLVSGFLDNAQISSFIGCPTYGDVDNEYLGLLLPKYAREKLQLCLIAAQGPFKTMSDQTHTARRFI